MLLEVVKRMNVPQVSVVMVVCNVDRFLSEAIESILAQTFRDFEFIVLEFGSTDRTKEIVSRYSAQDDRIKFHEISHCSLVDARNVACSLAQGQYIAIMDADDVCLQERLRWEVDFMDANSGVGLVGGAVEWIDAAGRPQGIQEVPCENHAIKLALVSRCPFWHPTVLVRRHALALVGGYRTAFVFAHDYDMELRIAEHFQVANLQQVVVKYRIHPSQVSFRKQRLQTLCKLAAKVSAASRKELQPDPLNAVREITPSLLTALGVSKSMQHDALVSDFLTWIRSLAGAGEYSTVLVAATEMLASDSVTVLSWQRAELYLTIAKIHWKLGEIPKAAGAVLHAILTRPVIVGRPLKGLLRRTNSSSAN
jgi:Glycosyl transferase family 2